MSTGCKGEDATVFTESAASLGAEDQL